MKANELMIGDWVMQFGEPRRIVGIRTDAFYPYIKTNMGDTWYEEGMKDLAEPIPLTPEILKKNGFDNTLGENLYRIHIIDDYNIYLSNNINRSGKKWSCLLVKSLSKGKDVITLDEVDEIYSYANKMDMYIDYVHELQHALRLCGIEKEIEL